MAAYCTQDDIEKIYGIRTVARWADLDGDEDHYEIARRLNWASDLATEYINSRFTRTLYVVPFTNVPVMIVNITAMYAGILLHDGRKVVSADDPDLVSRQRKDVQMYVRQILRGQLKLLHPTTQDELDVIIDNQSPFVVTMDTPVASNTNTDGKTIIFGSE